MVLPYFRATAILFLGPEGDDDEALEYISGPKHNHGGTEDQSGGPSISQVDV
jgi:hypothetical protein